VLILAEELGVDRALVRPAALNDVRLIARRPKDSSLNVSKAVGGGFSITSCEGMYEGLH